MTMLPKLVFVSTFAVTAVLYSVLVSFLVAVSEVKDLTAAQHGMAIAYGLLLSLWLGAEAGFFVFRSQPKYTSTASEDEEAASAEKLMEEKATSDGESKGPVMPTPAEAENARLFFIKTAHVPALRAAAEFVFIMGYIYVCDRTTLIAKGKKELSKTGFWMTNALILLCGVATFRQNHGMANQAPAEAKPMQRDQTEEWKGWMQIMFVLYHYFNEARSTTRSASTLRRTCG